MRPTSSIAFAAALVALTGLLTARAADAGCGCNKPPPPLAGVRPAFASPGSPVTLISSRFDVGKTYSVEFKGVTEFEVSARAVLKRDLADGVMKAQIVVAAPAMTAGPTRIKVKRYGDKIFEINDRDFTILQPAVTLAETDGETLISGYRAAVGANHTVYIPVDVSAIDDHMIFAGLGKNYPLLFDASDITIYNAQGFVMQLLGPAQASIFEIADPGQPHSLELVYDRHEFQTYRNDHAHVGGLGLDPTDPAWHSDGTRHIDHDHLVIAIRGVVENVGEPPAGRTPPFTLDVTTVLADPPAPSASPSPAPSASPEPSTEPSPAPSPTADASTNAAPPAADPSAAGSAVPTALPTPGL